MARRTNAQLLEENESLKKELEATKCETDKYMLMALHADETELTWSDVQKRFIMPAIKRDQIERPLFFKDARCGYQSLVQWIKEGYQTLKQPILHT